MDNEAKIMQLLQDIKQSTNELLEGQLKLIGKTSSIEESVNRLEGKVTSLEDGQREIIRLLKSSK